MSWFCLQQIKSLFFRSLKVPLLKRSQPRGSQLLNGPKANLSTAGIHMTAFSIPMKFRSSFREVKKNHSGQTYLAVLPQGSLLNQVIPSRNRMQKTKTSRLALMKAVTWNCAQSKFLSSTSHGSSRSMVTTLISLQYYKARALSSWRQT